MTDASSVLILGGGLAGLSFAIALATEAPDLDITVVEAHPFRSGTPNPLDTRASALNLHSVDRLDHWGIWSSLQAHSGPIHDIHVSHRGHFGSVLMSAADLNVEALGYVVENHQLGQALLLCAQKLGVSVKSPLRCTRLRRDHDLPAVETEDSELLTADLVLLAAGVASDWFNDLGITVDERATPNHALAFNVAFPGRQPGRAFERFTAEGPLAVLPLPSTALSGQRYNVVWSVSGQKISTLADLVDADFIEAFQAAFGWRLGRVTHVGKRSQWPLVRLVATEQFRAGYLLAGNAAHTLHPVAGQGLNLSIREADLLARAVSAAQILGQPIGHLNSLRPYLTKAGHEQRLVTGSTDLLSTLFDRRGFLLDAPLNASLAMLDMIPAARAKVAAMGAGRRDVSV